MIDCSRTERLLADESAGLLSDDAREELRRHIELCDKCRREEARFAGVLKMVESIPMKEPPYGLWLGIENRITNEPEKVPGWWPRFGRRLTLGLATATAALVLAVGGINHFEHTRQPVAPLEGSAHIMQYASLGADEPFSDRVALGSLAGMASDEASSADH